jgi:membrane-associated phospholipid phosphatase
MPLLDFNFNFNAGALPTVGGGLRFRPRFNSDVESRSVTLLPPRNLVPPELAGGPPNYPDFHPNWDADLQAYAYLDDFLHIIETGAVVAAVDAAAAAGGATPATVAAAAHAAASSWRTAYAGVARNGGTNLPPQEMTRDQLGDEALAILELALEREARFAEIIDQDDADGAINYWLGLLKIDPARHPATNLMVHVGRRIGEHVAMCLKYDFKSPRPPQLCPAITPMIDPPATPSYPAGHAVQAYLISLLLAYSFSNAAGQTNLPQHTQRQANSTVAEFLGDLPRGPMFRLARRVSQNRVIAGIHFRTDIRAGRAVAFQTFIDIQKVNSIWVDLRNQVRGEFPQYAR